MSFSTPILFLVFNRPQYTQQVFDSIRAAKPKQLFIAADGPRENVPDDIKNCQLVKDIVANVDWDCEIKTLYRDQNLGCGLAPSSAITWFFEHVEQGIILEDDCLPSISFFPFCQEMLERYKNDSRIHSICGTNLLKDWKRGDNSYFFSRESGIWGWATWKRSWKAYDYFISNWQNPEVVTLFKAQFDNRTHRDMYVNALDKISKNKEASFWDYQWIFSRLTNSQFGIIPAVNLISNIGFGNDATHTFDSNSEISNLPANDLLFPLNHPKAIMVDREYDQKLNDRFYKESIPQKISLFQRILNKILN